MIRFLRTRLRRFPHAKSGVAALEFALIAPMMIFLLLGTVELIDALGADRRAENVAASISDVVSRDTAISNAEVTGLWSAINVLMFPDTAATMDVRVTSVMISSATAANVTWSEVHNNFTQLAVNAPVTLPAAMMVPGTSVIMTEVVEHYTPPLNILYTGTFPILHTAYRRSRLVDPIPRVP
jgi:Flp pilus assembly protein TadG